MRAELKRYFEAAEAAAKEVLMEELAKKGKTSTAVAPFSVPKPGEGDAGAGVSGGGPAAEGTAAEAGGGADVVKPMKSVSINIPADIASGSSSSSSSSGGGGTMFATLPMSIPSAGVGTTTAGNPFAASGSTSGGFGFQNPGTQGAINGLGGPPASAASTAGTGVGSEPLSLPALSDDEDDDDYETNGVKQLTKISSLPLKSPKRMVALQLANSNPLFRY